jgi:hypothetical protein
LFYRDFAPTALPLTGAAKQIIGQDVVEVSHARPLAFASNFMKHLKVLKVVA